MKLSDYFAPKYLKAADVPTPITVTIEAVTEEDLTRPGEPQRIMPVVRFRGRKAGLVLNKTNGLQLGESFGDDFGDWTGRKVTLKSEMAVIRGERTACLRAYPADGAGHAANGGAPAPQPRPAAPAAELIDDDLPRF
jgi:hypothetical protein